MLKLNENQHFETEIGILTIAKLQTDAMLPIV